MLTYIFKSFLAVALFAIAELIIVSVFPTAQNLTYGLIAFSLAITSLLFAFVAYVNRYERVTRLLDALTDVISFDEIKRLAPIAENNEAVEAFFERVTLKYEATLSNCEQRLATAKATVEQLEATCKQLQSENKQLQSDLQATIERLQSEHKRLASNLERQVSELSLQLSNYKAKYELLESGTDEQKFEILRNMYFSTKNKINARNAKTE